MIQANKKMSSVNSCFASISELEILRIQEDAVLENTKKTTKFGLKVFKGKGRLHILQTSVLQSVLQIIIAKNATIFTTTICLIMSNFI